MGFSLLLSACAAAFTLLPGQAYAQQRQALQSHVTAPASAKLVGRIPESQQMSLAISLPLRNQQQLGALLQQLEDPSSPSYHHYLTVAQFTEQFGPTVADYQQVIAFAQSHGLTVTRSASNRLLLNVTGSAANVEQAFNVTMRVYQHPTEHRTFFAPDVTPSVEAGLPVLGVSGLTDRVLPHSMLTRASTAGGVQRETTGSGPGGQFLGSDIRAAYYGSGPLTGTGQALALAELGQWNMADVQAYFSAVGQPLNVPIVTELLGGTSGTCDDCDDGEEVIDIQQIISMAPGASVLVVYEDTSNNTDVDIFNAYATDNIAKQMSWSFGIGDGNAAADQQIFQEFHAQGQNFFVASGDAGANLGQGGWPGFSPDITDVGGTDLTTTGTGGDWSSETGWAGSGAGWCDTTLSAGPCYQSPYDAIPSYQSSPSSMLSAITANGGSALYRNVPDVAAEANTDNFFCSSGTCQGGIGGTSLAAPRWAGFLALANEQAATNGETIGFLNPLVYAIGQKSGYDTAFHDITSGSNPSGSGTAAGSTGSFNATTGFDMVTGWGTPNGQGMINALAPVPQTPTAHPYFTLAASPDTLSLTPGGAPGTATISLTAGNGFTGPVALSASVLGAPAGVTATVSPASVTGSGTSTLTVSTTGAVAGGTLMVAVTGTSGGGIQTQPAYVTLSLPDFTLSVSPTAIYLNQGATATPTVTVDPQNGFNGTVDLSLGGLPAGVTGSLNPSSTSTSSTLTLTASKTATTGAKSYLAVNGTSGNTTPPSAPYTFLSVSAATGTGGSGTPVNLASAFNLPGIYADGITFTSGLDGSGSAYSSTLLTPNRILNGVQYNFGPATTTSCGASGQSACTNNAVSSAGQVIALPAGQFTTLQLLATAIDGPVLSQTITVTYTDNTTSKFTQSFSDWCNCSQSPGQQHGESFAVAMPYRDNAAGTQDSSPFNLYAYTFLLNNGKTVQSLTLPPTLSKGAVIVLAATLTTQSLGTQVNLSSEYNVAGLYNNGVTFQGTGGLDEGGDGCTFSSGCSDAYSAQQLGLSSTTPPTLFAQGILFNFGPVNTANCTTACVLDMVNINPGVTIQLPSNQQSAYSTMTMLGTGVQGSHTGTVTVTYATGAPDVFNQTFDDWCSFSGNVPNESVAAGGFYRINSDGTLSTSAKCNLYSYTYTLDPARTVQSVALANTDSTDPNHALVLALAFSGSTAGAASYTLSAAPSSLSMVPGSAGTSTITLSPASGFTGSVSLAATGLPGGVTASFNPISISSTSPTSTLTLTASGTAATGSTTVTITGTSGSLTQTTTVGVTVTSGASYSLSAGAASPSSISPGGTSTSTITVTPANGYTGTVSLACSVASSGASSAAQATCSFGNTSPVAITNGAVKATMTFSAPATSAQVMHTSNTSYALMLPISGLLLIGLGLGSTGTGKNRLFGLVLFGAALAGLSVLSACGGQSSAGTGTSAATYTVTITGTDANGVIQSNSTPVAIAVTVN
jgi:hypothetical protein